MSWWLLLLCSGCQVVFPLRDHAPDDAALEPPVGCEDPDLLACFKFDDDLDDRTGRNFLFKQAITFVDGVDGRAVHTGDNSRLDVESPASLVADTELTIETWLRIDEPRPRDQILVDLDGCWTLAVTDMNQIRCTAITTSIVAPAMIGPGTWNHVACTQVDGQVQIFVNGVLASSQDGVDLKFDCTLAALAGDAPITAPPVPLNGSLDRLRIWNRTRTPGELKSEAGAFAK